MRICIFTSSFPVDSEDTAGYFVLELARSLVTKGHEIVVLCPEVMDLPYAREIDGVSVVRFRYWPWRRAQSLIGVEPGIKALKSWAKLLKVPAFVICQLVALYRLSKKYRIEVVNSHWLIPQGATAALVARLTRVRHVPTLHSTDVLLAAKLPFATPLCRFIDRHAHSTFVVSGFVRKRYAAILGYDPKVRTVTMGVDTERFHRKQSPSGDAESASRILFVGRLHPVKGVGILLEALALLVKTRPDTVLTVAGDGEQRTELEARTRQLGLERNVEFLGAVRNTELPDLYRAAKLLVVPSLLLPSGETEGMPVVVLEGMACGLPVVASDVGGISDVVKDNENGCLFTPGDAEEMAAAIVRALEHRQALSEGASRTGHQHAWPRICAAYMEAMQ